MVEQSDGGKKKSEEREREREREREKEWTTGCERCAKALAASGPCGVMCALLGSEEDRSRSEPAPFASKARAVRGADDPPRAS